MLALGSMFLLTIMLYRHLAFQLGPLPPSQAMGPLRAPPPSGYYLIQTEIEGNRIVSVNVRGHSPADNARYRSRSLRGTVTFAILSSMSDSGVTFSKVVASIRFNSSVIALSLHPAEALVSNNGNGNAANTVSARVAHVMGEFPRLNRSVENLQQIAYRAGNSRSTSFILKIAITLAVLFSILTEGIQRPLSRGTNRSNKVKPYSGVVSIRLRHVSFPLYRVGLIVSVTACMRRAEQTRLPAQKIRTSFMS